MEEHQQKIFDFITGQNKVTILQIWKSVPNNLDFNNQTRKFIREFLTSNGWKEERVKYRNLYYSVWHNPVNPWNPNEKSKP